MNDTAMTDTTADTDAVISIAMYRVKPGSEERFKEILKGHTATLRSLELISDRPVESFVGTERGIEGPLFVEIFEWTDARAPGVAHTHPQVSAVWETMGPLCEERGGRPMFEFPNVKPLDLN